MNYSGRRDARADGESLSEIWKLRGVNIVRINISCTTDILVHLIDKKALKGREYVGLFARVSKVHEYDYQVNTTEIMEVKVSNPAWIGDGPVLHRMRGSIQAYRITKSVWLPWWWPIITRARARLIDTSYQYLNLIRLSFDVMMNSEHAHASFEEQKTFYGFTGL